LFTPTGTAMLFIYIGVLKYYV